MDTAREYRYAIDLKKITACIYVYAQNAGQAGNRKMKYKLSNAEREVREIVTSGRQDAGQILARLKSVFRLWEAEPITDANIKGVYKDIEDILREAQAQADAQTDGLKKLAEREAAQ